MHALTAEQPPIDVVPPWDDAEADALIQELWALRRTMQADEVRLQAQGLHLGEGRLASAINLSHYLAMRRQDLRHLQERLARLGVSSLGRAETHVMANLDKVLGILHRLAGKPWSPLSQDEPTGFGSGRRLLERHARNLFGPLPQRRDVRIMVTLPSQAAHDPAWVDDLVAVGMDVARINCAHDHPAAWAAMAGAVRQAAAAAGRPVRVMMDVAGPKLRTGPIEAGPCVIRVKPERDAWGRVRAPAVFGLRPLGSDVPVPGAAVSLGVDPLWLADLAPGDPIGLDDARGAARTLTVVACGAAGAVVQAEQTLYLTPETVLHRLHRGGGTRCSTALGQIPPLPAALHLDRGDRLLVTARGLGRGASPAAPGRRARRARIACTLPEALPQVRVGHRVWFDDGRIGGVVRRCRATAIEVEITDVREGGDRLAADKGINLPDTELDLPALTPQDLEHLAVVARHADIVALSFAQSARDVALLQARLAELDAGHLGIVIKVETRRGFDRLPELLLAALSAPAAGVMIARGDLAVECGHERLAEVQEEILWACEAAHLPVVWATQVLESLAKTGRPSRAEITDAAMGGRAECVMLNKGPHILDAVRTLDDILVRMQQHQSKKRSLLRALSSWQARD